MSINSLGGIFMTTDQIKEVQPDEIWKEISGYNIPYYVSNFGRVKSANGFLKPMLNYGGYYRVSFYNGKKSIYKSVHSLVASAFIGKRKPKDVIEHINHDKSNNSLANIRYCSQTENCQRGARDNKTCKGEKHGNRKLTNKQILEIRNSELTQKQLKEKYKVSKSSISSILRGEVWTHV